MKEDETPPESSRLESKTDRDLFRIMTISTALGFGTLAAFLYSLKDLANDVSLEFSPGTVVSFVVGAALGWTFWRGVRYVMEKKG